MMIKLKCQCCGFEQEFEDGEEAFQAGWDCPPHFTGYVCCDLCPGSFVVLGITYQHAAAHARWAKDGRPAEFTPPNIEELTRGRIDMLTAEDFASVSGFPLLPDPPHPADCGCNECRGA